MSRGEPLNDEVARCRPRVLEAEWLKYQVTNCAIDRRTRHRLDDATRDAESGVVVAPRRAWRSNLHQVGDRSDEVLEGLGAAIRPRDLPFPSAEMRQQVPDRHVTADRFVAHTEIGQVRSHRCMKIDLALLHET